MGTPVGGQFAEDRKPEGGDFATPETMSIDDLIDQFRSDAKKEERKFEKTANPEDESGYIIDSSYKSGHIDALYDAVRELKADKSKTNVTRLITEFTAKSVDAKRKSDEYGVGDDLTDDIDGIADASCLNGFSEGYAYAAKKMMNVYGNESLPPSVIISSFTLEAEAADREYEETRASDDLEDISTASYADGRRQAYYDAASKLKNAKSKSDIIQLINQFTDEGQESDREYEETSASDDLEDISTASYADGRRQACYDVASKLRAMDASSLFG